MCSLRGTDCIFKNTSGYSKYLKALQRFKRLVVILSKYRPGFDRGPDHVRYEYVVDEVALEQVSDSVLRLSPVIIVPPMLHTHLQMHVAVARRTNRKPCEKQCAYGNQEALDRRYLHSVLKEVIIL